MATTNYTAAAPVSHLSDDELERLMQDDFHGLTVEDEGDECDPETDRLVAIVNSVLFTPAFYATLAEATARRQAAQA